MEKSWLLRKGPWYCCCVVLVLSIIYVLFVREVVLSWTKGSRAGCYLVSRAGLTELFMKRGRVEPPKLIVNLTILIHGWFPGKWPCTKIFTNFRLCDLAVITSCGYRCQITDTDMSRITEIGGGERIKSSASRLCIPGTVLNRNWQILQSSKDLYRLLVL